jgi:hypothetical protein
MQGENVDTMHHVRKLREMLTEVSDHARQDVNKVSDPKAQVLFETTAEVLTGLARAYEHFEQGREPAWKQSAAGSR